MTHHDDAGPRTSASSFLPRRFQQGASNPNLILMLLANIDLLIKSVVLCDTYDTFNQRLCSQRNSLVWKRNHERYSSAMLVVRVPVSGSEEK